MFQSTLCHFLRTILDRLVYDVTSTYYKLSFKLDAKYLLISLLTLVFCYIENISISHFIVFYLFSIYIRKYFYFFLKFFYFISVPNQELSPDPISFSKA